MQEISPPRLSGRFRRRKRRAGILDVVRVLADAIYAIFVLGYLFGGVAPSIYNLFQQKNLDDITWSDVGHVLLLDKLRFSTAHPESFIISVSFVVVLVFGSWLIVRQISDRVQSNRRNVVERQVRERKYTAGESPTDRAEAGDEDNSIRPEEAVEVLKSVEGARERPVLYDFLKWKYRDEPIFERGGVTFPLAFYPAPSAQRRDAESALIRPLKRRFPPVESLHGDSTMRDLIRAAGRPAENLSTFAMQELVVGDRIEMGCQLGKYFDMIDTCDALEWEILRASSSLKVASEAAFRKFEGRLPLRNKLHALVPNPVRSGQHRSVAVSLSALIAFYQDDGVYLMMRKRSEQVAVHAGLLHVIPSFMFQPATVEYDTEYSILHNIFREYLEEMYNRPDPKVDETDPNYFFNDPPLQELRHMLATDQAELFYSGIAVNLLSLRPEICTLLLIKDDQWYRRHASRDTDERQRFHLNLEFAHNFQEVVNNVALVGNIPLKATDEEILEYIEVSPWTMVPCGAFAFWAGVDLLRSMPDVQARISR